MKISKQQDGTTLVIGLEGRLDTATSPELEEEIRSSLDDVTDLVFDLNGLEYISSAGLRVLLAALKIMRGKGQMCVKNANEMVMEVFDLTGFSDILNVK